MTTRPDDPMPEPTPDWTVGEMSDSAREVAVSAWTLYSADDRCGTDADYDAFTEAVASAITVTERPADGVTISRQDAERMNDWPHRMSRTKKNPWTNGDRNAWERLSDQLEALAALSAASDTMNGK